MKIRLLAFLLLLAALLSICACSKDSTFSIRFIDVGQGDAALVECDGHYMLIDGGNVKGGDIVYNILKEERGGNGIQHLDILVISHFHKDHIGGLMKILTYASSIDRSVYMEENSNIEDFSELRGRIREYSSQVITEPSVGDKYDLGSATVEVVDAGGEEPNDSLVLLVTYGKATFLFTGDIEESAQTRISDKFQKGTDAQFKVDLMKIPHHGAYSYALYRFLGTFMPDYAVISVGERNTYGHPDQRTLDLLDSKTWKPKMYRTDQDGDIIVKSNGKEITVETEK